MKKLNFILMILFCIVIIFPSCDFDRNNYEEYIKLAYGNQVPFYDYEKSCTEYKSISKDAYGRELICSSGTTSRRWNVERQEYDYLYVYLICKPNIAKDKVYLYDIDCYMYSYELLDESSPLIENLKINNDWGKEIDYEKSISYPIERINQKIENSLIKKVEARFEFEHGEYHIDNIFINGEKVYFVREVLMEPEKVVYTFGKSYMFSFDENEEITNIKELPICEIEWQEHIRCWEAEANRLGGATLSQSKKPPLPQDGYNSYWDLIKLFF